MDEQNSEETNQIDEIDLTKVDENGNKYIHRIMKDNAISSDQVEEIVKNNSSLLLDCGEDGLLPIHLALKYKSSNNQLIETLARSSPESLSVPDSSGNLAIHLAILNNAPLQIWKIILSIQPETISKPNSELNLPIHAALISKCSDKKVIDLLISSHNPEAILSFENDQGFIPLHIGISSGVSIEIIDALLTWWPESIHKKNRSGETALEIALGNDGVSSDIMELLILRDMPITMSGDTRNHEYSWTRFLASNLKNELKSLILRSILNKYKAYVTLLCESIDSTGRPSIEIDPTLKVVFLEHLFFCRRYKIVSVVDESLESPLSLQFIVEDHGLLDDYNRLFDMNAIDGILTNKTFMSAINSLAMKQDLYSNQGTIELTNQDSINKNEFLSYCSNRFGLKRKCRLKLFNHQSMYNQEISIQRLENIHLYALTYEIAIDAEILKRAITIHSKALDVSLIGYDYGLVYSDPDIVPFVPEFHQYDHDVEDYLQNILDGIVYFHDHQYLLGSINKMNIVYHEQRYKFIHIHLFISKERTESNHESYLGLLFNTSVLPPEMFYELKSIYEIDRYHKYWSVKPNQLDFDVIDRLIPYKIVSSYGKRYYVPRSYRLNESGEPDKIGLPYDLKTSDDHGERIDSWGYGVVMYSVLYRKPFLPMTSHGNIDRNYVESAFAVLRGEHNETIIESMITNPVQTMITNTPMWYQELLIRLLSPDPLKRISIHETRKLMTDELIKATTGTKKVFPADIFTLICHDIHNSMNEAVVSGRKSRASDVDQSSEVLNGESKGLPTPITSKPSMKPIQGTLEQRSPSMTAPSTRSLLSAHSMMGLSVAFQSDVNNVPPMKTGIVNKRNLIPFMKDKPIYLVLEMGTLTYYDKQGSQPNKGETILGNIPSLKWKTVSILGRSVIIRGEDRVDLELRFESVSIRDEWSNAIYQHILFARSH